MKNRAFFVASTGQHVGKTTTCLGLLSGLKKRFQNVGFMKPIGQEHVEIEKGVKVDKDVVLFKETFQLKDDYPIMSPVLFPKGFTRDFLDNKIQTQDLINSINHSHEMLTKVNDVVIVEGTGHVGVGSIADLNNAEAAQILKTPLVIIASGGLGSSYDAMALNKLMCDHYNVRIAGVILNKVLNEKRDMISTYMTKALAKWNIPILGLIPFNQLLSNPSIKDYASLLSSELLSGEEHRLRHFQRLRLVATSLKVYQGLIAPSQLIITPASREDIILATLSKHWDVEINNPKENLEAGFILTGSQNPSKNIISQLKRANIPMLYTPENTFDVMKKITSYTAKIRKDDKEKVKAAISLVESHIDFDLLIDQLDLG